ncbi:hypothetical protein BV22DRAFT_968262, partial [Leucogyrophana mollusca]
DVSPDNPIYPWPSKAHFITSLLFSSPRVPFSEAQKNAVLNWAKELGARDVPSLSALKACHSKLESLVGNPTEKVTARTGDIFYINNVAEAIAKDYANPLTRFAMQDYPEDNGKGMSQVFNGEKMLLELPSPPAVRVDGTIYFKDELLQDTSGCYFIPERFFTGLDTSIDVDEPGNGPDAKILYALGRAVTRTDAGFIISDEQEIVNTSTFKRSFDVISACHGELDCGLTESSVKYGSLTCNPLRTKSAGRMVYTVPPIIFMDDVSGNISKQWNKHHAIYMSNANLPREMLEKEFFVRFVSSSPHAPPMELMRAMKHSICEAAESGVITWDCRDEEEVMLVPYGLFVAGDNPMQAEECSHAGLNCNYFCRTCDVGGTKQYKESEMGYNSIFSSGSLRTPEGTVEEIRRQFNIGLKSGATEKIKTSVSSTGVRDSSSGYILNTLVELGKKMRKREPGSQVRPESEVTARLEKEFEDLLKGDSLQDAINPLFGMNGVNIHLDTPTEILHTILLGVVKYFWGQTVFLLEKAKLLNVFQSRLESIEKEGLNAPCLGADYICHYKGSLIGKHFKSLAQVMPFLIHDLVPRTVLNGWTSIGELVVLVWHTEIKNTEEYLAKLSRTIDDFLNITAQCAPSILISKPKFHFLVHLPAFIRRFGPAIIFSTERYESFNHVFRMSCIYSNRQAPSRDTCRTFARQDIVKHITTGGYWYDNARKRWVRAGAQVLSYLRDHPEQARLLGLSSFIAEPLQAGETRESIKDAIPWAQTRCAAVLQPPPQPDDSYLPGKSLVTAEGETGHVNSHVIFRNADGKTGVGRIREILISPSDGKTVEYVAIQLFSFSAALHPSLYLPCLELGDEEVAVAAADVVCTINVQHNCIDSQCVDTRQQPVPQERLESTVTKTVLQHKSTPHYFLNVYSIHNYVHIQSIIPTALRETPVRVTNVAEVRSNAVKQLKDKRAAKKSGELDQVENEDTAMQTASEQPPAFDRAPAKPRAGRKAKATAATATSKTRGKGKGKAPMAPTEAVAGSSSQLPSVQLEHS